ncbi:ABC transporter permease [Lapidilactobacillus bayanensis]|uniref:ABC transporter permease n=1 Tax=Lapidilactobacillus bayanensis TaxID=2485998 RepID=UPI000F76F686|nr:ABC transporter permease [Lapidilactobacillus bayanensis]
MIRANTVLHMMQIELAMEVKTRRKYLLATLSDFVIFTIAYAAVLFFADVSEINSSYHTHDGVLLVLIGFMFWNAGVMAMDLSMQTIETDSRAGILETEMQSKFPLWFLTLIRSWVSNLITFGYLLLVGIATAIIVGRSVLTIIEIVFLVMLVSCIANLGMFGLGLVLGAGSLVFKNIGQWATVLQGVILIFANVAIPYTSWIQAVLPFGLGIEIVRDLYLDQKITLVTVLAYLVVNVIFFGVGLLIFNAALRYERKYGSFERF